MSGEPPVTFDLEAFRENLAAAVSNARSIEEVEAWLKSQPCVRSVELASHLLKSNPPQQELAVEMKAADGSIIRRVVRVFHLYDEGFQLAELCES